MNSIIGRFHKEEINGKQFFVYHLDNTNNNKLSVPTLFLCPEVRLQSSVKQYIDLYGELEFNVMEYMDIDCSPYFNGVIQENEFSYENNERVDLDNHYHYVLPYFGFKNDEHYGCNSCNVCHKGLEIGIDYYVCVKCRGIYHKECVESPPEIKHPYHPNHPLKLFYFRTNQSLVYWCTLCGVCIGSIHAFKSIPFVIEKSKRHDHRLTFFTRKDHLRCNVCGLLNINHSTYVCVKCDFVVHQTCVDIPSIIRISRHHHRISFTSSLLPRKWFCGVCRKNVDGDYGAYTCNKCDGYVVHSRCALRKDIWDGKELEGISEEDVIEDILDPFERMSDGLILHFLHGHALTPQTSGEIYDESKICHVCVLPIYEGKFYSCMECDFILHDTCANAPRKIRHPLHPHPLTLKVTSDYDNSRFIICMACKCESSGFVYECNENDNCFNLDVRCGSISEPFDYQGHEHPLFLALDPQERHSCQVCQKDNRILINCIECDFIICLRCVNLPYMAKYKHDKHFLTLVHENESKEPNWCEVCEGLLISAEEEFEDEEDKRFYECKQCCTTLHINCLLGKTPFIKSGHIILSKIQVIANNSPSRPFCKHCSDRCADKIFFKNDKLTVCCLNYIIYILATPT